MHRNLWRAAAFALGLVAAGLIYWMVGFGIVFSIFVLGGQRFSERLSQELNSFCLALLLLTGVFFIARYFYRSGRRALAAGIITSSVTAVFFVGLLGMEYLNDAGGHVPFEKTAWQRAEYKPIGMAKTLSGGNMLIGRSRKDVLSLLGSDSYSGKGANPDQLLYYTDQWCMFCVSFKNGVVTEACLWKRGLDR